MGFFDSLDAEKYDRTYKDSDLFQRIVGYFKPQWKRLVGVALFTLMIAGAGSLLPIMVSRGVDLLKGMPTLWSLLVSGRGGDDCGRGDLVQQHGFAPLDHQIHRRRGGETGY